MKVRRVALSLAGLVAAGVVVAVLMGQWKATPRITEEQVEKIQVGMTLEQVDAVLGCRPGNYTPRQDFLPIDIRFYEEEKQVRRASYKEWAADTPDPRYTDGNGPDRQEAIAVRVWFD